MHSFFLFKIQLHIVLQISFTPCINKLISKTFEHLATSETQGKISASENKQIIMDTDSHDRGRSELRSSSSPDQLVHKHNTVWKCVQHSLKGALLGFFGVVVPLTLKSWRKKRILGMWLFVFWKYQFFFYDKQFFFFFAEPCQDPKDIFQPNTFQLTLFWLPNLPLHFFHLYLKAFDFSILIDYFFKNYFHFFFFLVIFFKFIEFSNTS